ncbi:MAG TPA: ActS/PrrB/RegB family redox-sensitive histidine kinase [Xanthobacteraceae bacterium]|nr:ActS/PrrB/RegB family redox-sensitive histidine kinase [Xanthobacteraceae bacterium]
MPETPAALDDHPAQVPLVPPRLPWRSVRLDTLLRLRWVAAFGQVLAILVVFAVLGFPVPVYSSLGIIALSLCVNLVLRLRYPNERRLDPGQVAWLLAFDIASLSGLLFLTGGLENPFSFFIIAPVLLTATALPARLVMMLAGFAILCATLLIFFSYPLPWDPDEIFELPLIYLIAIWLSIVLAIGFISIHAWQINDESRQLSDALAATELALARVQHLSQLDGLAAAAAHELGTPLATITVVSRELERMMEPGSRYLSDVRLLREQAQRCREILGKLTKLPSGGAPFDRLKVSALIDEAVIPYRTFGVAVDVTLAGDAGEEPICARNPALLYGLGNLIENAVDFARGRVEIRAEWDSDHVVISIRDDGPGFAPDVIDRIGEPYVTTRRRSASEKSSGGLGLGFFIAQTLLQRAGARLSFKNNPLPQTGAIVTLRWKRSVFEDMAAEADA